MSREPSKQAIFGAVVGGLGAGPDVRNGVKVGRKESQDPLPGVS
jgi:hypothetical protein